MGEMRVDLSELEETVRRLGRISTAMEDSTTKGKYNTSLPPGAVGTDFKEADKLAAAHESMQGHIQEIMRVLNGVIEDFGTNTKKAHGKYQDAEHDAKNGMGGGQTGPGG